MFRTKDGSVAEYNLRRSLFVPIEKMYFAAFVAVVYFLDIIFFGHICDAY